MSTNNDIIVLAAAPRRRLPLILAVVIVLAAITTGIVVATGGSKASAEVLVHNAALKAATANVVSYDLSGDFTEGGFGSMNLTGSGYVSLRPKVSYLQMGLSVFTMKVSERIFIDYSTSTAHVAINEGGAWQTQTLPLGSVPSGLDKTSQLTDQLDVLTAGGFTATDRGSDQYGHRYDYTGSAAKMISSLAKQNGLSADLRQSATSIIQAAKAMTLSGTLWIDDATGRPTRFSTSTSLNGLKGTVVMTYRDWNVSQDASALFTAGR